MLAEAVRLKATSSRAGRGGTKRFDPALADGGQRLLGLFGQQRPGLLGGQGQRGEAVDGLLDRRGHHPGEQPLGVGAHLVVAADQGDRHAEAAGQPGVEVHLAHGQAVEADLVDDPAVDGVVEHAVAACLALVVAEQEAGVDAGIDGLHLAQQLGGAGEQPGGGCRVE
jgi:hypothetical protein